MTTSGPDLPWDEAALAAMTAEALELCHADEAEIIIMGTDHHLARFSQGVIRQHTSETSLELRVRAIRGNSVGVATTTDLTRFGIERVTHRAAAMAAIQPPDPGFAGLAAPAAVPRIPETCHPATLHIAPDDRESAVNELMTVIADEGGEASGHHATEGRVLAVRNSRGVWAHHIGTRAEWSVVASVREASGYAARLSPDHQTIRPEVLGHEALYRALAGQPGAPPAAGRHRVMLEPYAVADLLTLLAYTSFGATAVAQGTSFLATPGRERVAAPVVTLRDNGLDPTMAALPFDYEGVPRQAVDLLREGFPGSCVHDSRSARQAGLVSTGHALPPPNPYGPFPVHLDMQAGAHDPEAMLAALGDGLLITRFHYTSVVDPRATRITGLTRDGVLKVRDGRIVGTHRNARFTQGILDLLMGVVAVGRDLFLQGSFLGCVRCPAIVIEGLNLEG
ncbi:MAG: TldD/PmbA family protein [Candidatus Sericytochromatia bacterium]|nr:TldD/PmbA family protein [Candidatus Sericytochromatia bacterium]